MIIIWYNEYYVYGSYICSYMFVIIICYENKVLSEVHIYENYMFMTIMCL